MRGSRGKIALGFGVLAAWSGVVVACGLDLAGSGSSSSGDGGGGGGGGATADSSKASDTGTQIETDGSPGDEAGDPDAGDSAVPTPVPDFAWYLLSEPSGMTAHDSTTHHYDITFSQAPTWGSGAAFSSDDQITGEVIVDRSMRTPPVSITVWLTPKARSDETDNNHATLPFPENAVSSDIPGQYGCSLGLNIWTDGDAGTALGVENENDHLLAPGNAPFVSGTEYFIAAVYGPTQTTVFVNGAMVTQAATNQPGTQNAASPLRIGYHNEDGTYGTKRFFNGRIRDVRVFKRTLTGVDVSALLAAGPQSVP